jgi:hypothetical protein
VEGEMKAKETSNWAENSLKEIKFREKVAHNKITSFSSRKNFRREKFLANQLIIARQNETIDYDFSKWKLFFSHPFLKQNETKLFKSWSTAS